MKHTIAIVLILFLSVNIIWSQSASFELNFTVTADNGPSSIITIGTDPSALENLDPLDIEGPPAPPPAGGYDAWFAITGARLVKDVRQGDIPLTGEKIHSLNFQVPTGAIQMDISFNVPESVTLNFKDAVSNGSLINSTFDTPGLGSVIITNLFITILNVTVTYDGLLPVELTSFTGAVSGDDVNLLWETATELNNYGFEIERNNTLSLHEAGNEDVWQTMGFVKGNGSSSSPHNYSFSDETVSAGKTYSYRLKQIDNDGSFTYSNVIEVSLGQPIEYRLNQNYPNPFNPSTKISFTLPQSGFANLTVFNLLGEQAAVLINEHKDAGFFTVEFDAGNLQSGVYFYKLSTNGFDFTRKMMLIK